MFKLIVTLLITFMPLTMAQAQWFEATGKSPLLNGDLDTARNLAVQDALKQALLFSGAQVKSIAQISNGLLTSDRFEVRSQGSVRDLQLVSETHHADHVIVTIRADILAQDSECSAANTVSKIALTKFPIRYRQQATTGGVFNLGQQTAAQLYQILNHHRGSFKATKLLDIEQNLTQQLGAIETLSQHADTQYILTGELVDISMYKPKSKWFGLSSHDPMRQFELALTLFDGNNSETVWQKSYATQGSWPDESTTLVTVKSNEFWQSPYGTAINSQLQLIASDLNEVLYCNELSGSVVNVDNQQLTINLGSSHGVKAGDKFNVYHNKQFIDNHGISRQTLVLNPSVLIAQNVNRNHTTVNVGDAMSYGDINVSDIVKKQ